MPTTDQDEPRRSRRPRCDKRRIESTAKSGDQTQGYDEADEFWRDWLVPSHDERGHSIREQIRIPPGMERAMQIIIQGGKTPYGTKADLIRHAVFRHLIELEGRQSRAGKHFLVGLRLSQQLISDECYREELETLFRRMEHNIQMFLQRGEQGEASRQAALQWAQFSAVADSVWKRNYVQRFLHQYGFLLGFRTQGRLTAVPEREQTGPPEILDAEIVGDTGEDGED